MRSCFRLSKNRAHGHQSILKFAPAIVDIRPTGTPSFTTSQSASFHSPVGRETEETHIVPNDDGAKSTRSIILSGDELKVSSPAPTKGKSELVLRRSKWTLAHKRMKPMCAVVAVRELTIASTGRRTRACLFFRPCLIRGPGCVKTWSML